MTKQHFASRAEFARPLPQILTITCAGCQIENVSPDGSLPQGWKPVPGGVRCSDCGPSNRRARSNG
ncbi:hypothetical protein [Sphingobium sp.]|uniref:hypothetical protein n=1 Tax=Sphingobium sp. TaxID=1912891 RepID=UPI0028BD53F6|nr:hypothetical protein [Sphingobium sp.]